MAKGKNVRVSWTIDKKKLRSLSGDVKKRASKAVQETRADLAREMRSRAPRREGELAESIKEYEPGPTRGVVWVDAKHGIHVEYGTSRMPAQPFIRPAAKAVEAEWKKRAEAVFDE